MTAIGSVETSVRPWAWAILTAWLLGPGCGGIRTADRPGMERDGGSSTNRREEDIRKAQETVRILKAQLGAAVAEKEALGAELADLRSAVRVERQGSDQLAAEKAKVEDRLRAAEARSEGSKKTLERACILLGLVATEIATVRKHWREFEARVRESGVREEDLDFLERNALLGKKIEEIHFELLRERNLIAPYVKERKPDAFLAEEREDERTRERRINQGGEGDPLLDPARSPFIAAGPRALPGPGVRRPPRPDGAGEEASPGPGDGSRIEALLAQEWNEMSRTGDIGLKAAVAVLCAAALVLLCRRWQLHRAPVSLWLGIRAAASRVGLGLGRARGGEVVLVPPREIEKVLGVLEEAEEGAARAEEEADMGAAPPAILEGTPAERARARIAAAAAASAQAEALSAEPASDAMAENDPTLALVDATDPAAAAPVPDTGLLGELPAPPGQVAPTDTIPAPDTKGWGSAGADTGKIEPIDAGQTQTIAGDFEEPGGTELIREASTESWTVARPEEPAPSGHELGTQEIPGEVRDDFRPTQVLSEDGGREFGSTQVISDDEGEDHSSTQVIGKKANERPAPREVTPDELFADDPPLDLLREPRRPKAPARAPRTPQKAEPPAKQPPKGKPPRKHRVEDEDLLAELEEIIGHKMDEETA